MNRERFFKDDRLPFAEGRYSQDSRRVFKPQEMVVLGLVRSRLELGEVAVVQAQVNWAGRTSMEVGVRVEAEDTLKATRVRPGMQIVERYYGLLEVHSKSQAEARAAGANAVLAKHSERLRLSAVLQEVGLRNRDPEAARSRASDPVISPVARATLGW